MGGCEGAGVEGPDGGADAPPEDDVGGKVEGVGGEVAAGVDAGGDVGGKDAPPDKGVGE